jgi:hypothetical protein
VVFQNCDFRRIENVNDVSESEGFVFLLPFVSFKKSHEQWTLMGGTTEKAVFYELTGILESYWGFLMRFSLPDWFSSFSLLSSGCWS